MHVAKINHAYDLARRGPRITDQHVVVVGIAINHAASQARQQGKDFSFIERQKLLDKRAPLHVRDMFDKVPDPSGARRIPFQFAMGSGVRKRLQRRIHLAEKTAEITKNLRRVRADFGQSRSNHKSKQPHKAPRAVRGDRKSTRLNSSHLVISYAVFCLKKKTSKTILFLSLPLTAAARTEVMLALALARQVK